MPLFNIGHIYCEMQSNSLFFDIANKSFFTLNYSDLPTIAFTMHQSLEHVIIICYRDIQFNTADNICI